MGNLFSRTRSPATELERVALTIDDLKQKLLTISSVSWLSQFWKQLSILIISEKLHHFVLLLHGSADRSEHCNGSHLASIRRSNQKLCGRWPRIRSHCDCPSWPLHHQLVLRVENRPYHTEARVYHFSENHSPGPCQRNAQIQRSQRNFGPLRKRRVRKTSGEAFNRSTADVDAKEDWSCWNT